MESIELLGAEVLPEFAERDEAARAATAAKWEPAIEAALARRSRHEPTMPDDYVMKAIPKQMVDAMQSEPAQQWLKNLADKQAAGVEDEEFDGWLTADPPLVTSPRGKLWWINAERGKIDVWNL